MQVHLARSIRFAAGGALLIAGLATPAYPQDRTVSLGDLSDSLRGVAARVAPGVVQVFISRYAPGLGDEAAGIELYARQRGTGSGVILDPSGYIVTNAHVVEGAERIRVLLATPAAVIAESHSILKPSGESLPATLVGLDRETDLALLKVEASGLTALELGDSDQLTPGALVFAFGSPLGLSTSMTMGVVSAVGRQLEPEHPMVYIQTDASINPGNSGGPLVDTAGRVVGINTLILSQSGGNEGLGFAAPSNIVRHVVRQLRESGRVRRGQIGASVQTITPALAEALGLPGTEGVLVSDVVPGGPAETGGLQTGDVILSLDGKPMENGRQFTVNLYQRIPGETIVLQGVRNQATRTFRIEVRERGDDPARFAGMVTPERNLIPRLGILALAVEGPVARLLPPRRRDGGVLVAARGAGAASGPEALEPGDIILGVNRSRVAGLEELKRGIAEAPPGATVVLQIERRGGTRYLTVVLD